MGVFLSPSSVEDIIPKLPQRVAVPQLEALIAKTFQHLEVIAINVLVVSISKRYSDPGAITPLVDAALDLLVFCTVLVLFSPLIILNTSYHCKYQRDGFVRHGIKQVGEYYAIA